MFEQFSFSFILHYQEELLTMVDERYILRQLTFLLDEVIQFY